MSDPNTIWRVADHDGFYAQVNILALGSAPLAQARKLLRVYSRLDASGEALAVLWPLLQTALDVTQTRLEELRTTDLLSLDWVTRQSPDIAAWSDKRVSAYKRALWTDYKTKAKRLQALQDFYTNTLTK